MADRGRPQRVLKAGAPRQKVWAGGVTFPLTQLSGGVNNVQTIISEAILEGQGLPTIVRCRGWVHIQMDRSAEAAEDKAIVNFGIAVVEARALSIGVTAMPLPGTNAEFPFLWMGIATLASPTTLTEDEGGARFQRLELDTKAMRKVRAGHVLVFITQVQNVTGTSEIEFWGCVRVLLMPA